MSYIPKEVIYVKHVNDNRIYVVPAGKEERLENARNWAKRYTDKTPFEVKIKNRVKYIKLIDVEHRTGGYVFKAEIDNGYIVDFRSWNLVDVLQECVCEYGVLKGDFVWASVGSSMQPILVGSELYNDLIAGEKAKQIKESDLVIGKLYRLKSEDRYYVGKSGSYFWKAKNSTYLKSTKSLPKCIVIDANEDIESFLSTKLEGNKEQLLRLNKGENLDFYENYYRERVIKRLGKDIKLIETLLNRNK